MRDVKGQLNLLYVYRINAFLTFLCFKFDFVVLLNLDSVQASYVYEEVFFAEIICNKSVAL